MASIPLLAIRAKPACVSPSAKTSPIFKDLSFVGIADKMEKTALTSSALTTEDLSTNLSWTGRIGLGLQQLPGSELPSSAIGRHALGVPTTTNVFRGVYSLVQDKQQLSMCESIGDSDGVDEARINMAESGCQTLYGVEHIALKSVGIAVETHPSAALHAVFLLLEVLDNILFMALCVGMVALSALKAYRAYSVYKEYEKNGKTFSALLESIFVQPKEIEQTLNTEETSLRICGEEFLDKASNNKAYDLEMQYLSLSPEWRDAFLNHILKEYFSEYPELIAVKEFYFSKSNRALSLELSVAIGLFFHLRNRQLVNEARFVRAFNPACLEKIKRAALRGLQERSEPLPPSAIQSSAAKERVQLLHETALKERVKLLDEIDGSYIHKQRFHKALIIIGCIGCVLCILALLVSGPIGLGVLLGLSLIVGVSFVALSTYEFKHAFQGRPGPHDSLFIKVCAALVIIGMVVAIAAFLGLGGAPIILGLSLILGAALLGIYFYAHHLSNQQAIKYKEDHPTTENLTTRLEELEEGQRQEKVDKDILSLFKKLPKSVRKEITDRISQHAFSNKRYAGWDLSGEFGRICLEKCLEEGILFNQIEKEQIQRAVKKTAKFLWTQWWYSNQQEYFKEQALKMEYLLASMEKGNIVQARKAYAEIIAGDTYISHMLYKHILRIFKREESAQGMLAAVRAIQSQQKQHAE